MADRAKARARGAEARETKPEPRAARRSTAPEGLAALDKVIHERARLGIVSALAVNEVLTFNELRELLGLTDGNLSVHARKLEEAGYVACRKSFENRMPRSEYRLTAEGRRALERHLEHLAAVIRWARS
ncbi:MAG TPA: transcriptional regulator [Candidatus Eisenbacteria bacterium]|nr:transcriptional regulator [Candidatus Eisenbacteria bacterium]